MRFPIVAARETLLNIFRAGLAAADPAGAIRRSVVLRGDSLEVGGRVYDLRRTGRILVVGAGKASARMAQALEEILGGRISGGWVNVKTGHALPLRRVHVHEAGHPVPDEAGVRGAMEIARSVQGLSGNDLVFFCLSGGGSALLPLPVEGVTLADKQRVTQNLLACGATIREVNTVRKHLSQLKGGQLARLARPAQMAALILSDVIGDPLDVIASGPTAPDTTSFADALNVLRKYAIEQTTPANVVNHLRAGAAGKVPETPKPGDPLFDGVQNLLVANNSLSVEACAREAEESGYRPLVLSTGAAGEARDVAREHVALARKILAEGKPVRAPACVISGGETTVTLRGKGLGGRNQEFALAAAIAADGLEGFSLLAAGTDGTDGPTDAAGAFADATTVSRARALGLNAEDCLARNDSYHFFEPLGDLLRTGPTGTNVMDLYLMLLSAES